jgi:outer membrane protein assembly factor BamA
VFFVCFVVHAFCLRAQNNPIFIQSIIFEGNKGISSRQLKQFLRMTREGGEYSPGNMQYDLQQLELACQDSGFLKAKVGAPDVQVQTVGDKKIASIRIAITEGPQYITRTLAVSNSGVLAPETLIQLCPTQKGQPYGRIKAAQWQSKVEEAYREIGYVRIRCRIHESINETAKTVDCTLDCVEGKPYSIGKITITGNGQPNPLEFKRRLLFSEGGVFNPEMIAMTIQFLNQANLYEPITNSDVGIAIDDEKGTVDVSLRVVLRK